MKIVRKDEVVEYKEVRPGEVFQVEGSYYMATEPVGNDFGGVNCVDLETGALVEFDDPDKVIRINGHFVID